MSGTSFGVRLGKWRPAPPCCRHSWDRPVPPRFSLAICRFSCAPATRHQPIERDAWARLFKLPGSSIPLEGFRELTLWGWPKLPSIPDTIAAAARSAAAHPRSTWGRYAAALRGVPLEAFPLRHFGDGVGYDARWDAPPMVAHLEAHSAPPDPPAPVRIWVAAAVTQRMPSVVPAGAPEMSPSVLDRLQAFAASATPQWAVVTMRLFLNLWVTSCRMHICDADPCLYGCRARDTFAHYLVCPYVRGALSAVTSCDVSGASVSECFGIQGGRGLETLESAFRRAALATAMYHAARARHRVERIGCDEARRVSAAHARDVWPEMGAVARLVEVPSGAHAARSCSRPFAGRAPPWRSAPPSRHDAPLAQAHTFARASGV